MEDSKMKQFKIADGSRYIYLTEAEMDRLWLSSDIIKIEAGVLVRGVYNLQDALDDNNYTEVIDNKEYNTARSLLDI